MVYGHGPFETGILAGGGAYSGGPYMGIAPAVNILGVRVGDDSGLADESGVVGGLQWIVNNRAADNIRVVNLSMNSAQQVDYDQSSLDAACEILWFNGVAVVVSAGDHGSAALYPPANDPFAITVGAAGDRPPPPSATISWPASPPGVWPDRAGPCPSSWLPAAA